MTNRVDDGERQPLGLLPELVGEHEIRAGVVDRVRHGDTRNGPRDLRVSGSGGDRRLVVRVEAPEQDDTIGELHRAMVPKTPKGRSRGPS
jgi:hypothetical protein